MKISSTCILLSTLVFSGRAEGEFEARKAALPYTITETGLDKKLKKTEAVFDLHFRTRSGKNITEKIKFSYNGRELTVQPDKAGNYSLKTKPGKYKFQFWYNDKHQEIFTDSIQVLAANRVGITTHFQSSTEAVICFKPVIYLYSPNITHAEVKLDLKKDFDFTYPRYNNGWKVKVYADGALEQDNKIYNYLFWEGPTDITSEDISRKEGFVVNGNELTVFFEEKLAQLGLNSREIQDYVTYWVPRMQNQPRHFIRFLLNENFDHYAPLTISPKPDHVLRVFMLSSPLEEKESISVKAQTLPTFTREGFYVIEWGGTIVNMNPEHAINH